MTTQHDKPKRWRPRFSVRTLVIIVTLVCCYAACWGPTKTRGVSDVDSYVRDFNYFTVEDPVATTSVCPLIVACDEPIIQVSLGMVFYASTSHRRYYFWFFGYGVKLPYERETSFPSTLSHDPPAGGTGHVRLTSKRGVDNSGLEPFTPKR